MQCYAKPKAATCTGPYTEFACSFCEGMEGKCMGSGKNKDCIGPSNEKIACGYCKNLEKKGCNFSSDLNAARKATKEWMLGLSLDNVPPIKSIYTSADRYSPAQIDQKFKQADLALCPFVEIGQLFTTITTGNDQGWVDLIKGTLYRRGYRQFAIFTGRHGHEQGNVTNDYDDLFTDKVPEAKHLLEDKLKKVEVDSHYAGSDAKPSIKLYNVGTTAGSTMSKTKRLALERLRAGDTVIFAWCFSFLSVYKTTTEGAKRKLYDSTLGYNKTIPDIINEQYGWVQVASMGRKRKLKNAQRKKYVKWRVEAAETGEDENSATSASSHFHAH